MRVRPATEADVDAVAAFTRETWRERDVGDYIPRLFPEWVATDDERQRTLVLDARAPGADGAPDPDDLAGIVQGKLLTDHEGWVQGLRVNPTYRGEGCGARLLEAALAFTREAGATVARCMIFSWNAPSLGLCRSVGFQPATEFRWAYPDPDPDADPEAGGFSVDDGADADAAWQFWTASDARDHLRGLALDDEEWWALSTLTRERLRSAAADDRLFVVNRTDAAPDADWSEGGTRGFTYRVRTFERPIGTDPDGEARSDSELWAEYAVGAWASPAAARAVLRAAARDAAAVGADRARLLVPESARWVSDVALARGGLADEPDFVLAADLGDERVGSR